MFEQIFQLFQDGLQRLRILILIIVWLTAAFPQSGFVMCYFNRLSGKLDYLEGEGEGVRGECVGLAFSYSRERNYAERFAYVGSSRRF